MKKVIFSLMMVAVLILSACMPSPAPTSLPPTGTAVPPTPTPQGRTLLVTSAADSGPGTLRQAMFEAKPYDVITFDPTVFPPDAPATIAVTSRLPELNKGNITIDASDAGVILDGSNITTPELIHGISISSDNNIIRGLQIVGFSDAGIALFNGAQYNVIGGDWNTGDRRTGQSNLISGNGNFGIGLWGEDTSYNTIQGNMLGITWNGGEIWGHARDGIHSNGATHNLITGNIIGGSGSAGVYLCCVAEGWNVVIDNQIGAGFGRIPLANSLAGVLIDRTSHNVVGPGNLIAFNTGDGISFWEDTPFNTVTQNRIWDNGGRGIVIMSPGQSTLQPPLIINFDIKAGTLSGAACPNCIGEIFSDTNDQGGIYEGRTEAGEDGAFIFVKGASLTGPILTATATDPDGNTSEFSSPTQGNSRNLNLQVGNLLPIFPLQTKPSNQLADNRIGDVAAVEHISERVWNTGYKWMHLIVDYNGRWQYVNWEREAYALDPREEQVVDDLRSHGVKIQLVLDVWEWQYRVVDYRTEEGIQRYLNWVRYLVRHFKGQIEYYEILNEPDPTVTPLGEIAADDYINILTLRSQTDRIEFAKFGISGMNGMQIEF